jgi:hypothetical protein
VPSRQPSAVDPAVASGTSGEADQEEEEGEGEGEEDEEEEEGEEEENHQEEEEGEEETGAGQHSDQEATPYREVFYLVGRPGCLFEAKPYLVGRPGGVPPDLPPGVECVLCRGHKGWHERFDPELNMWDADHMKAGYSVHGKIIAEAIAQFAQRVRCCLALAPGGMQVSERDQCSWEEIPANEKPTMMDGVEMRRNNAASNAKKKEFADGWCKERKWRAECGISDLEWQEQCEKARKLRTEIPVCLRTAVPCTHKEHARLLCCAAALGGAVEKAGKAIWWPRRRKGGWKS